MKPYTINQAVEAEKMNRLDYNNLRGWVLPADENGADEGYLVLDSEGDSNTKDYKGYVCWLPAAEFKRKYHEIYTSILNDRVKQYDTELTWQEKLHNERNSLKNKYDLLTLFVCSDEFKKVDINEHYRLKRQRFVMGEYLDVLNERISNIKYVGEGAK